MAKKIQDGLIMGALLGAALTTPKLTVWVTDFLNSVIPTNWYLFGSWSLTIFGVVIGLVIGAIVDRT